MLEMCEGLIYKCDKENGVRQDLSERCLPPLDSLAPEGEAPCACSTPNPASISSKYLCLWFSQWLLECSVLLLMALSGFQASASGCKDPGRGQSAGLGLLGPSPNSPPA